MTRVITLGSIVAVGGGTLLGAALAYQLVPLTVLAALLGLAGTFVVVRAAPEPAPASSAPFTLGGPLARPVAEEPLAHPVIAEEAEEPATAAVPVPVLPVPVVAAVPDAA